MSKLNDQQKSLISLYARSRKETDIDGWVHVSNQLWEYVKKTAMPEMFEVGDQQIRLTEAGKVILEFGL